MKKPRFLPILTAALLSGVLTLPPPALAAEKSEAPVSIPATAPAIWQAIDQQSAALSRAIQTGAFAEVHHRAYAIRDLVATLAQRLDATGDAKDRPGTESNFRKLQQVLTAIRANYPETLRK